MTKNTPTWGISFPEGSQKVAVPADVENTATTTDAALTDAQADITENVMGQVDTQITEATENVVHKQTSEAAWTRDEDAADADIAYTVVFEEGRRSWIESDTRGYPTSWSERLLVETLEPYWGNGGGGGGGEAAGFTTTVSGGGGDILDIVSPHPYPQVRLVNNDEPILSLEDAGVGESIGYQMMFFDIVGDLWLAWSTDHAPTWQQSGTWVAKFNDGPLNGIDKSTIQKVYLSANVGGAQHETPMISAHRYAVEGVYLQLYSKGGGRGKQSTFLATAPQITGPWTDQGVVQQMESQLQPGNGHTGYLYPQRINGRWQSTSRYGAGGFGRQGYWYGSEDWRTWRPDPRYMSDFIDVLETFDWFDPEAGGTAGHRFTANWPIRYNGTYWKMTGISGSNFQDPDYGNQVGRIVAPLSDDLRNVKGLPIDVGLDTPSPGVGYISWDGKAYGVTRVGGPRTAGETCFVMREIY